MSATGHVPQSLRSSFMFYVSISGGQALRKVVYVYKDRAKSEVLGSEKLIPPEFPNERMYMINSEEEWKIYESLKHQGVELRNKET